MRSATSLPGFTIIELMITILIAGVVVGLAVPAFDGLIQRNRTTAEFNRFLGDIAFARSEAVKRSQNVVICPTTNQNTCAGDNWDGGWLVFATVNDDRTVDTGDGDEILRVGMPTKGNVDITENGFPNDSISFGGDGKMEGGVAANIGHFVICDDEGAAQAKGLTFSPFGQYRRLRDTTNDGIIDSGGQSVSC